MHYPVSFQTGQPNKVHHSYIWLSSLLGVGLAVGIGLLSSIDDLVQLALFVGDTGFPFVLVLVLGVLAVAVLYGIIVGISALAYKNLRFVFDEAEFSVYSGIITKRRVHVPYARVQSVNHKQSLFQRIAGVCTVEIDTAGGSTNKAVKVPYVELGVGEAIRADLFVRKAAMLANASDQVVYAPGAAPASIPPAAPSGSANILDDVAGGISDEFRGLYGGAIAGMEPISFERRLANSELFLTSISSSGVISTLVTLLILVAVGIAPVVASGIGDIIPWFVGLALVPILLIGFVVLLGISTATVALSYGNFALRRRGKRVEVERGIIQRSFTGIDIDRIQSIVIRQSFIRRLMGYCEVSFGRIDTASDDNQGTSANLNRRGLVVHPFLKLDQVEPLLSQLVPEYTDRPTAADFRGVADVALRRGIIRRGLWRNWFFWFVVFVALCQVVFNVGLANTVALVSPDAISMVHAVNLACVLLYIFFAMHLVFIVLGTFWWARGSGWAVNARYLALRNDGLQTETIYVARQKVQDVGTRTNPFQRAAGVATITALTAAGVGGTYSGLWDVSQEDADAWLDWLKPRTSVVQ